MCGLGWPPLGVGSRCCGPRPRPALAFRSRQDRPLPQAARSTRIRAVCSIGGHLSAAASHAQGNRLGEAPHPAGYATRGLELTAATTLATLRRGYRGRRPAGCTRCPCSESRLCPSYLKDPTPGEGGSFPGRDAIRTGTAFSRDCSAQIPPAPPLASRLRALRAAPRPRRRRGSGRGCGRRFGGPPKPPPPPRRPRRGRRRV